MQVFGWTHVSRNLNDELPTNLLRVTTLRGVAALMVAGGHSLMVFAVDGLPTLWNVPFAEVPGIQSLATKALLVLFNGNSAVTLFFVISGFVLGLSLDRVKGGLISTYLTFVIRRAFRVYPALILSLLVVGALMPWIVSIDKTVLGSEWFNSLYRATFGIADLWDNVLLVNTDMNPVSWTLRIELLIALFFPVLHAYTRKTGPWFDVAMLVGLMWISSEYTRADSQQWVVAFYFGLVLPRWGGWIEQITRTSPAGENAGILLAIATFLSTTHVVIEAASASVVIACLIYGPELRWFHWLDLMWLRLVGRVSYSFYLIHLIILYCLVRATMQIPDAWIASIPPIAMNVLLACTSILAATLLAQLMFVWIETPFMALGKHVSQRLTGLGCSPHLHRSKDGVA